MFTYSPPFNSSSEKSTYLVIIVVYFAASSGDIFSRIEASVADFKFVKIRIASASLIFVMTGADDFADICSNVVTISLKSRLESSLSRTSTAISSRSFSCSISNFSFSVADLSRSCLDFEQLGFFLLNFRLHRHKPLFENEITHNQDLLLSFQ